MSRIGLIEEPLTESIIGAFFEVYNGLGYGFLEQIYVRALVEELHERAHMVAREVPAVVNYKGKRLGTQRIDMIVENKVVVEVKSTLQLAAVAERQLFNYLKATNLEVGLLLHFGPQPKFYRQIALNHHTAVSVKSGSSA